MGSSHVFGSFLDGGGVFPVAGFIICTLSTSIGICTCLLDRTHHAAGIEVQLGVPVALRGYLLIVVVYGKHKCCYMVTTS